MIRLPPELVEMAADIGLLPRQDVGGDQEPHQITPPPEKRLKQSLTELRAQLASGKPDRVE